MTEENATINLDTLRVARMKIFKITEEEYEAVNKLVKENASRATSGIQKDTHHGYPKHQVKITDKMSWTEAVRCVKITPPLEVTTQEANSDFQKDTQQGIQKDNKMGKGEEKCQ